MSFLTMTSYLGEDFSSIIIPKTIYVILGYVFAQLIDNFLSQPYIFSSSVKSHPLEIFLVIFIRWNFIWNCGNDFSNSTLHSY